MVLGVVKDAGGTGAAGAVRNAAVLLWTLSTGSAAAGDAAGAVPIGEFFVAVEAQAGKCMLRVARGETAAAFSLPLPAPCGLHATAGGAPRVVARGKDIFFLVESSTPAEAGDCDTRIQAVRLDRYGADLAPRVERVAACSPFEWDEAVFLSMFPVE